MSEITETLYPGERVVFTNRPSRFTQLRWYGASLLVFLFSVYLGRWWGVALAFLPVAAAEVSLMAVNYHYTNNRVIAERGLLSKDWKHIFYDKVTDVSISKGALGRFLDIGDVVINTAGSDIYEMRIESVNDPEAIQRYLLNANRSSS